MFTSIKLPRLLLYCFVCLCALCSAPSYATAWPEIKDPPHSKVVWVGDDMTQNGVAMQIKTFASDLDVKSVIEFYRNSWAALSLAAKPVENDLGEWKVIGYQQGDYLVTVQVRPQEKNGSEGHMAVSKLPTFKGQPELDSTFPRLPGTKILSDTRSQDAGKIGKTLILTNSNSVQSNQKYYESAMLQQGWTAAQSSSPQDANGVYLYFQRSKEACVLTISRDPKAGGSQIVVNVVQSTIL